APAGYAPVPHPDRRWHPPAGAAAPTRTPQGPHGIVAPPGGSQHWRLHAISICVTPALLSRCRRLAHGRWRPCTSAAAPGLTATVWEVFHMSPAAAATPGATTSTITGASGRSLIAASGPGGGQAPARPPGSSEETAGPSTGGRGGRTPAGIAGAAARPLSRLGDAGPCPAAQARIPGEEGSAGGGGQGLAQFRRLGDQRSCRFGPVLRLVQLPERLERDGPEAGRALGGDVADGVVEQWPRVVQPAHLQERLAEADLGRHGVHQIAGLPGRAHRQRQQPHGGGVTALPQAHGAEAVPGLCLAADAARRLLDPQDPGEARRGVAGPVLVEV